MKFKWDENIPYDLSIYLSNLGYDTHTVEQEELSGAVDPAVLTSAVKEQRILVTYDTDFADIRTYPIGTHCGIIVFRLDDQRWSSLKEIVDKLMQRDDLKRLNHGLAIIDENKIRIRSG